jgi:hypothetical protein
VLAEDQRDWTRAIPTLAGERSIGFEADPTPAPAQFFTADSTSKLRQILTASAGAPKLDAVDLPLAKRSKQVLAATAKRAGGGTIGLLHILWGLSDADNSVSTVLRTPEIDHSRTCRRTGCSSIRVDREVKPRR